jgi:endonuclease/exonuclease/phosphatase family metal-dependent hydrolase
MLFLISVFTLTYVHLIAAAEPLKVCSFNVQIFGQNKAKNPEVMKILGKIFSRYDLCLIQEIRDTNDASINALLKQINGKSDNYRMILSDRLGRSNSKEQYGFFYNKNKINVTDSFHFDDESKGDLFEREPFIVRFKAPSAPVKDFFIAGIHTNPSAAKEEVGHLVEAYDDAVKRFKINDGIIMGDFNAACSYFAKKYWKENALRQDSRFSWLIGDDINTTVGKADCAYDRVVVGGDKLKEHTKKAQTWYYDADHKIDLDMARLVSDHYPIEFKIE